MKRMGVLLVIGCLASEGMAQAATYYVSKSGSNNNSCTAAQSSGSARGTINAGLSCLAAGDTLLIRGGTYDERITSVPSGTAWTSVVRIAAYPGESVWLKPQSSGSPGTIWLDGNFHYVEFDGIGVDNSLVTDYPIWFSTNNGNDPHHIRYKNAEVIAGTTGGGAAINLGAHTRIGATGGFEIQRVTIHGGGNGNTCGYMCASGGVYIEGPNNLVEDCDIYDTAGWAIQIYNAGGDSPDNNTVRRNVFHDIKRFGDPNQLWGVLISGNNNATYNNVIYNIGTAGGRLGDGIDFYGGSNNSAYNNTIYKVANRGIDVSSGASGSILRNNLSYNNGVTNYNNSGSGTIAENNWFNGSDPLFTNASNGNFHLQSGSPVINAGTTVPLVTTDVEGTPRPQGSAYDIGAYEYRGASTLSPPTGVRVVQN
jgi:hypothetical protein